MTQADSVHSTPPTNTSASNPPDGPEKPQDSFYLPTDISPEEVFQAIGRLRKEARDEIDRLIRFLDKTDNYVSNELEENGDELDASFPEGVGPRILSSPAEDDEDGADDEPSLGSNELPSGAVSYLPSVSFGHLDVEGEHDGREPSEDDEEGHDREGDELQHGGDEHDGAEPDADGEPSLGWTLGGSFGDTGGMGDDREIGGSIMADDQTHWVGSGRHDTGMHPAEMQAIQDRYRDGGERGITVEDRGYGGRKVIRHLTDEQQAALHSKLDPYGTISVR
jgi:hypothetical protein